MHGRLRRNSTTIFKVKFKPRILVVVVRFVLGVLVGRKGEASVGFMQEREAGKRRRIAIVQLMQPQRA